MPEITLAFIAIVLILLTGIGAAVIAFIKQDHEKVILATVILCVGLIFAGIRYTITHDDDEAERVKIVCIKEGKQVVDVLGHKVCKM